MRRDGWCYSFLFYYFFYFFYFFIFFVGVYIYLIVGRREGERYIGEREREVGGVCAGS